MANTNYIELKDEVTIVIPCYNEVNYIRQTLTALSLQHGIAGTRVIVCDNNSNDGTISEIIKCQKLFRNKIKIEIRSGGRVAKARNIGASLATTKYVLFLDADSVLTNKSQILDCVNIIKSKALHLVTCKAKSTSSAIMSRLAFSSFNIVNSILSKKIPFAVGTFFLTDRNQFFIKGKFDETLQHSEDFILSKKYEVSRFAIVPHYIGQDDRRFKKMGYFGMTKLLVKSFINRNNLDFFRKDVGYWL